MLFYCIVHHFGALHWAPSVCANRIVWLLEKAIHWKGRGGAWGSNLEGLAFMAISMGVKFRSQNKLWNWPMSTACRQWRCFLTAVTEGWAELDLEGARGNYLKVLKEPMVGVCCSGFIILPEALYRDWPVDISARNKKTRQKRKWKSRSDSFNLNGDAKRWLFIYLHNKLGKKKESCSFQLGHQERAFSTSHPCLKHGWLEPGRSSRSLHYCTLALEFPAL